MICYYGDSIAIYAAKIKKLITTIKYSKSCVKLLVST